MKEPRPEPASPRSSAGAGHDDLDVREVLLRAHRFLELEDVLDVLRETIAAWTGVDGAFVFLKGDRPGTYVEASSSRPGGDARGRLLAEIDEAALEMLVREGAETVVEGLGPFAAGTAAWPGRLPEHSVAFPARGRDGRLGGVILALGLPPEPEGRAAVHRLLGGAVEAVGNALDVAAIKELVIRDDTAQCFNRRHFEESLPEELSRATRFKSALSLIFFDMDNLKEVNSRHGHAMGSQTLREVSQRVRTKIRKFDKLFRFGGDEFCILLPETEWHGALEVAERVREAIAGNSFLTEHVSDPAGVKMTASFGISSYPLHARSGKDLVQRADRAMQRIKNGTKNSIAIAEILGDGNDES